MKKLILAVLSITFALMINAVCVFADGTSVQCETAGFKVTVTAEPSVSENTSVKIYMLADGAPFGNPIYYGQLSPSNSAESFKFDLNSASGDFRIVLGNKYTKDFKFINPVAKVDFYNELRSCKSADDLTEIFEKNSDAIDFDTQSYFDISDEIRNKINAQIISHGYPEVVALPENYNELDSAEQAAATERMENSIKAFEGEFKPCFEKLVAIGETEAYDGDKFVAAVDKLGFLDKKFYGDTKLSMPKDEVAKMYKLPAVKLVDYSDDAVKKSFNTAVLLTAVKTMDNATVTQALEYYNNVCVRLDLTYSSSLSTAEKNELSAMLKKDIGSISSAADLESKYLEYSKQLKNAEKGGQTTGGSRGGGGGGGVLHPSIPSVTPSDNDGKTFGDLQNVSWAEKEINYLAEKNIVNGKENNKFFPDDNITREEFVKIAALAFEFNASESTLAFEDVENSRWSYGYIAAAVNDGIITGISEKAFAPEQNITRQDMAVIIYRIADKRGMDFGGNAKTFSDSADIADYAVDAIEKLSAAEIMNGDENNMFCPTENVTRAQAAKAIYNLMKKLEDV